MTADAPQHAADALVADVVRTGSSIQSRNRGGHQLAIFCGAGPRPGRPGGEFDVSPGVRWNLRGECQCVMAVDTEMTHNWHASVCSAQQSGAGRAIDRSPRVGVASGGHPDPTALESTFGPRTAHQIRTGDGRSAGELHMAVPARRGRDAVCRRRRSPRRDRRRAEPIDRRCDAGVVPHPAPLVRRRQVVWTVQPTARLRHSDPPAR